MNINTYLSNIIITIYGAYIYDNRMKLYSNTIPK